MMKKARVLSVATAVAAGLLASSSLLALPPGTRTPDQMVNLQADKDSPCPFYGVAVNQQINSDGTVSPFSIPSGYSLMITGFDWKQAFRTSTPAFNSRNEAKLSIQGVAPAVILTDFRLNTSSIEDGGSVTGIADVVVSSGVALCYGQPGWISTDIRDLRVNVHGYLVKNRGKGTGEGGMDANSRTRR